MANQAPTTHHAHRLLIMQMMQNSAHILCINEADVSLYPDEGKTLEHIKLFIKCGYKGIVIKLWSSKSIACFVRGGKHARVELLARYISTKSQLWSTTFGMFMFGIHRNIHVPQPEVYWTEIATTRHRIMAWQEQQDCRHPHRAEQ